MPRMRLPPGLSKYNDQQEDYRNKLYHHHLFHATGCRSSPACKQLSFHLRPKINNTNRYRKDCFCQGFLFLMIGTAAYSEFFRLLI